MIIIFHRSPDIRNFWLHANFPPFSPFFAFAGKVMVMFFLSIDNTTSGNWVHACKEMRYSNSTKREGTAKTAKSPSSFFLFSYFVIASTGNTRVLQFLFADWPETRLIFLLFGFSLLRALIKRVSLTYLAKRCSTIFYRKEVYPTS